MTQVIPIAQTTLYDLTQQFGLIAVTDPDFFPEWREDLPDLTVREQEQLDRVKTAYLNLAMRSVLEGMVKMVVVSPLLELAGFYFPPFFTTSEPPVELTLADQEVQLRGRVDVLVIQDQLWVLAIESKRSGFSVEMGMPQILAYLLAAPPQPQPFFGLVTNGSNFIFVKLSQAQRPHYQFSEEFSLRRGNDLAIVLKILKGLATQLKDTENSDVPLPN